jgi:hypothetical protein
MTSKTHTIMAGEDIARRMSRFAQPKSLYLADAAAALSVAALQQVPGSGGEALGAEYGRLSELLLRLGL